MKYLVLLMLTAFWSANAIANDGLVLGVDRSELYRPILNQRRIGLVVNQASLSRGRHTIDILRAQNLQLVKLFALEHGIRGDGGSGESIPDSVDPISGLPIVSLYGRNFKPSPEMLADIDVIVFDIQDVGTRFYTFISSLGLIMEAAAENNRGVVVFDRPNPNSDYVEGPIMKPENKSFLGAFPIPVVYGLTIGELATMIHGEGWKNTRGLSLDVMPMLNYDRENVSAPEGIPTSGLRTLNAMRVYPSIALFEPTVMSVGKGTDHPYEQYGLPERAVGPHVFIPRAKWPGHKPLYENQRCYGREFYSVPASQVTRFTTDLFTDGLQKTKRRPFLKDKKFLRLLVGDNLVVEDMLAGKPYKEIRPRFEKELNNFKLRRQKYFLYGIPLT